MLDSSEEWKSLLPISSSFSPPLLLLRGGAKSPTKKQQPTSTSQDQEEPGPTSQEQQQQKEQQKEEQEVGPLIFNPSPKTLTLLLSSLSSLSPRLPPPFPHLSLHRFLSTTPHPSSLLPSTASSVAAQLPSTASSLSDPVRHNRLQLLRCPGSNRVLVFFPTGDNSDRVGFAVVSADQKTGLSVKRNYTGDGYGDGRDGDGVLVSPEKFDHRILRLLVNPVPHSCSGSGNSSSSSSSSTTTATIITIGGM